MFNIINKILSHNWFRGRRAHADGPAYFDVYFYQSPVYSVMYKLTFKWTCKSYVHVYSPWTTIRIQYIQGSSVVGQNGYDVL